MSELNEFTNVYADGGNADAQITFNYRNASSETRKPNTETGGYVRTSAPSAEVNVTSIKAENTNGNIFLGWYTVPDGSTGSPSASAATVLVQTGDTLLKADFVAKTNYTDYTDIGLHNYKYYILVAKYRLASTYTVAYAPGTGGTGTAQTVVKTEGAALTLAGALFWRTGYTQTGWATSDGGPKVYELGGAYTTDAAVTLYPAWTANTYTVTLSDVHHNAQTISVTYGSAYGALPYPVVAGYTFAGWYTAASGGTRVTGDTVVSTAADHTLYAHWDVVTYTVVYNANGGSGTMANSVFAYGDSSALVPACGFTNLGSICVGWSLTADGAAAYFSGVTALSQIAADLGGPSGPINLYAVWEAATYTVSFDATSYQGAPLPSMTVKFGERYGELPSVQYDGNPNFIFEGWFYGDVEINTGDRVRIAEDITLSAHFHAKRVTILLDATCGGRWKPDSEGTKSVEWVYDGSRPSITPPSMTDYEFEYYRVGVQDVYYSDGTVGNLDWSSVADGEIITAVADWHRERHTITFNSNGGSSVPPAVLGFHEFIGDIAPPTRTGYTFAGWEPRIPRFMPKNDDTECTAQWTANTYALKYALVGGAFASGATVAESATFGTAFAVPAPTRSGCTFAGWKVTSGLDATTAMYGAASGSINTAIESEETLCANGASGTVYFKNLSAENGAEVVLTAQWTRTERNVTFNPGTSGTYAVDGSTAFVKVKRPGIPIGLNDTQSETFEGKYNLRQVGWSSNNLSANSANAALEYPIGGDYDVDPQYDTTFYPVWRESTSEFVKAIPVTLTADYKVGDDTKSISAVVMAIAGRHLSLDSIVRAWMEGVSTQYISKFVFNDGVGEPVEVEDNPGSVGFDISSGSSGVSVTLIHSESTKSHGIKLCFAPGSFAVDDLGASCKVGLQPTLPLLASRVDVVEIINGDATIPLKSTVCFHRDGYDQVGWTDVVGGATVEETEGQGFSGTVYDFGDTYVGGEAVLYPVWEPNEYSVSYDLKGGAWPERFEDYVTGSLIDEYVSGVPKTNGIPFDDLLWVPAPERAGYRFVGWFVKGSNSGGNNLSSYLADFYEPSEDSSEISKSNFDSYGPRSAYEVLAAATYPPQELSPAPTLPDGVTAYRLGEVMIFRGLLNKERGSGASVTLEAVWRKNTKYRVRFNKVDSETGNVTFTTKEHELGEEWTLPKVGGETAERSGTEGDQDVTTELGWSFPGNRFLFWATDFGRFADGEKIVLGGDVEVGENEVFDFYAAWDYIVSHVTFRADDWQTETLEASGDTVDGLVDVTPASASRTMSDSPGKVDHGFILEPTETFTPQRTFGQKAFALVTDYVSQMSVLLRDETLWTEKVTKDREYLLSYASLIPVTAGYAYGNDRTMGMVKVNGKGVPVGESTVTDGVLYADEVTFRAEPLGGYRFVGWYTSATDISSATLYSKAAETVVFMDMPAGLALYARFAPDPNGIYEWEGSNVNKLMEWKSKLYVGSKPFNPAALRVDATGYPPVEVTVGMFSSPDEDATATARLTNIVSQDSRRLPRMRPERYMQIGLKHDEEVDAVFVGTSMGGLAV